MCVRACLSECRFFFYSSERRRGLALQLLRSFQRYPALMLLLRFPLCARTRVCVCACACACACARASVCVCARALFYVPVCRVLRLRAHACVGGREGRAWHGVMGVTKGQWLGLPLASDAFLPTTKVGVVGHHLLECMADVKEEGWGPRSPEAQVGDAPISPASPSRRPASPRLGPAASGDRQDLYRTASSAKTWCAAACCCVGHEVGGGGGPWLVLERHDGIIL